MRSRRYVPFFVNTKNSDYVHRRETRWVYTTILSVVIPLRGIMGDSYFLFLSVLSNFFEIYQKCITLEIETIKSYLKEGNEMEDYKARIKGTRLKEETGDLGLNPHFTTY